MPYQTASATNYQDALDELNDFATAIGAMIGALSATINAGGTGYVIGEDIDLAGGSFKRAARFNIDSEGAASAVINAAGTGYSVSDVLTVVGGTFTTAATFTVTQVGGSGEVELISGGVPTLPGDYTVTPGPTALATTVVPGGGTSCTLDLTFGAVATVSVIDHGVYSEIDGGGQPSSPAGTVAVSPATGTGCTLTPIYSPEIVAIGSSYVVGDVIVVSGGTSTSITTLEVTSVDGGGGVTGIKYLEHGGYSVEPTNTVSTTGGTGTGLTLDLNYDTNGWTLQRNNVEAISATISGGSGGTGYSVGEKLTLVGGIDVKSATIFNIDTISGSAVATVSVDPTDGDYGETPADPAATTVSPSGGTGCTLVVTYQRVTGTKDRDLILLGDAAGAPTIGIRTYSKGSARSWELRGMTAYSAANAWEAQPDICDGDNVPNEQGQYVPLDNASLTYFFYVEGASIRATFKISTTYPNAYSGFLDRLGTAVEIPYPMLIMGCSSAASRVFSSGVIGFSGMCDPVAAAVGHQGPGRVRNQGGTWQVVKNSEDNGSGRNISQDTVIWPAGTPDPTDALLQDRGSTNAFEFNDIIPSTGNPGAPTIDMIQTPDSPEDRSSMIRPVVIESSPTLQFLGAMRGVRWLSAKASPSNLVSEDTVTDTGGNTWDVFQNCNQTDQWKFFCLRREQ